MIIKSLCAFVVLAWLGITGAKANTIYVVHDFDQNENALVDGTITTDGHVGVLNVADIVAWNLTIGIPYPPFMDTLTNGNGTVQLGGDVVATATALLLNYDTGGFLIFRSGQIPGLVGIIAYQSGFAAAAQICLLSQSDCVGPLETNLRSGIGVIASVTPLPTTFPLFVTGLGALGFLGWRRKNSSMRCHLVN